MDIDRMLGNIIGKKKLSRRQDWDGDGVPNKKDCQPRNTMRQDARESIFNIDLIGSRYESYTDNLLKKMNIKILNKTVGFFNYTSQSEIIWKIKTSDNKINNFGKLLSKKTGDFSIIKQ